MSLNEGFTPMTDKLYMSIQLVTPVKVLLANAFWRLPSISGARDAGYADADGVALTICA